MVVVGMGGSGIAGDVLHAVASPLLPVPVTVVKGYECPHFVDETTLVFAVSCSGGTEETIEAASDAALAGAKMVVVTSGGELGRLADAWKAPLLHRPGGGVAARRSGLDGGAAASGSSGGSASCRAPTCGWRGRSNSSGTGGTSSSVPGPRPSRRSWPGGSARASPSSTAAVLWGPWPPSAGRRRSTRTPSGWPSGAPSPSCATTRSAAGPRGRRRSAP